MDDPRERVKPEVLEWLLEPENPSVRYFTLRNLLDRSEADPETARARNEIMTRGVAAEILSGQEPGGFWGDPKKFYTAKYAGSVWQLIILAELGADGNDPRIRKACEFILSASQDAESGGFALNTSAKNSGGRHSEVIPCLTGNVLRFLVRFGMLDDPRVRRGIEWFTTYARFDDGDGDPPRTWPYEKFEMCWGKHTCHMAVVKMLKAFAEIPEDARTPAVRDALDRGAEYVLLHRVHRHSHDLSKTAKPGWLKPGFPLMYQSDILEILLILTALGRRDERMNDALEALLSKRNSDGRWNLENTFNGKYLVDIEETGKPSKWITLRSLEVLKRLGGVRIDGA